MAPAIKTQGALVRIWWVGRANSASASGVRGRGHPKYPWSRYVGSWRQKPARPRVDVEIQ